MAEVKGKDVKVGETYRVRLGRGNYGTARVVAVHTFGAEKVPTGVKVEWLDAPRGKTVVNPETLETA